MLNNTKLLTTAATSYLLLSLITIYFKYFPIIINPAISNILISLLIFTFIFILIYGSCFIRGNLDVYFFLPQSLIFCFIARAIPNIRLSYPPLHDPYFHYVCTSNILFIGSLEPVFSWWYGMLNRQLHWPAMHLNTVALVDIANINLMQIFRFQEPIMGIIFFLAMFCLAKTVSKNDTVALWAGLFTCINDITIFYQSEYHPQGISMVYFLLIIYVFIKSRQFSGMSYRYILLIFSLIFMLSHYFTPLFLSIILSSYVFVKIIFSATSKLNLFNKSLPDIPLEYNCLLIIILMSVSYHIFVYTPVIEGFMNTIGSNPTLNTNLIKLGVKTVPLLTSILASSKWLMFFLAVISLLWIFRTKNKLEFRLGLLLFCIIFSGIIGNYVIVSPLDRIISYYVPFAAFFASLTVYRFKNEWFDFINQNRKAICCASVTALILTMSFFNAYQPSFYFQDSKIDTYYWYSNRLPKMDEYVAGGSWFGIYKFSNFCSVGTEFDTRTIPFYYGKHPDKKIQLLSGKNVDPYLKDYIMVNPQIPYNYKNNKKQEFEKNMDVIYCNEEIIIYKTN